MSSLNSSPQQPRFFEAPLSCFSEASTRLLPRETKWHTLKRVSQDHLEWPDFLPLAGFFRTILHGLIVASCRPHLGAPTPARTVAKVVKGVGWGAAQTASKSARTYLRSSTK